MSTMDIFDLTDTWNSAGTTFSAIKMNVTDTASASGSLLLDLQVGGVSQFNVSKVGNVTANNFIATASFRTRSNNAVLTFGESDDIQLFRDAANTLAQRRGTNAQAFRIYNTFTDASNYEQGFMRWSANVLEIRTEAAGTGIARTLRLQAGSSSGIEFETNGRTNLLGNNGHLFNNSILLFATNTPDVLRMVNGSQSSGAAFQLQEMTAPAAPAVNNVRIYAVDNGSGKTQLMALFATGAAQQIAIEP